MSVIVLSYYHSSLQNIKCCIFMTNKTIVSYYERTEKIYCFISIQLKLLPLYNETLPPLKNAIILVFKWYALQIDFSAKTMTDLNSFASADFCEERKDSKYRPTNNLSLWQWLKIYKKKKEGKKTSMKSNVDRWWLHIALKTYYRNKNCRR